MKAKEIIRLYEDEEKLSSDEIADLINNYFIKKCKSIGMEIGFNIFSSPFSASLTMASQISFGVAQEQKYFQQYLKKIFDFLKKNNIKVKRQASTLDVYLSHAVSPLWINRYVFYIHIHLDNSGVVVEIRKFYSLLDAEVEEELANYEEFSSELGLSEVYRLIDVMVKAIRLTPFEV